MEKKRSIGILSVDAKILADRLRKAEPGETVTYDEMEELIGRDVRGKYRYLLASARRLLEREERIVFDAVSRKGVIRLTNDEIAMTSHTYVRRTHSTAVRGIRRTACADYDKLSRESKVAHNTTLSVLGVLEHFTKPRTIKRLQSNVESAGETLAFAKTIELFKE